MKKIILFFAGVLLTYGAYAQQQKFVLSTHVNFIKSTYTSGLQTEQVNYTAKNRQAVVTPRLAYRLNKRWAVGASYSYDKATITQISTISFLDEITYITYDVHSKNQQVGAFVQSYLYDDGRFSAFLEGAAIAGKSTIGIGSDYDTEIIAANNKTKQLGAAIHSGVRYNFFKGLGVEARLNNLVVYSNSWGKNEQFNGEGLFVLNDVLGSASIGVSFSF